MPSVLSADFTRLGEAMEAMTAAGADRIQWDVMDGHFVPNLTFGPDVIAACRPLTDLPFEAHLMVDRPEDHLDRYIEAGCDWLILHAETTPHLHRTLGYVRDAGPRTGVALNPSTPIEMVADVLDLTDMVLVMTVNPGFGGQSYISTMEPKIEKARELVERSGLDIDIQVDGGISAATIGSAAGAGANVFVSGSAAFGHPSGLEHAIKELRATAEQARGA